MKKILFITALFLLISVNAWAAQPAGNQQYSATLANTKISAVDGTAFIDFGGTIDLAPWVRAGAYIVVYDSSNRKIRGFLKAGEMGTGETFDPDVIVNDFTDGSWNVSSCIVLNSTTIQSTAVSGYINTNNQVVTGRCYRVNFDATLSGTGISRIGFSGSPYWSDPAVNQYGTAIVGNSYPRITFIGTTIGDTLTIIWGSTSVEWVKTPSTTGAWIFSTNGGATKNFTYKNSSFNYADSSGYKIEFYNPGPTGRLAASGSGSPTLNVTAGAAAIDFGGAPDLANYVGSATGPATPFYIVFTDLAGKHATAFMQATDGGTGCLLVSTMNGSTRNMTYTESGFDNTDDPMVYAIYYAF